MYKGTDLDTFTDVEETDSLRSVDLMSTGAEHINVKLIYIDRDLSECLNSVCMEQDSMLMCDLSDLFQRLKSTDLIVCSHNRDQDGLRCNGFLKLIQINESVLIYIQICDLRTALFFKVFTGMKDGMMLNLCCDDVVTFILVCLKSCFQSPVIRLGTTCCKIDFFFLGSDHICNLLSSLGNSSLAVCSKIINSRSISIKLCKIRQHCLHNFRCGLCGSRIVQIYHFSHFLFLLFRIIIFRVFSGSLRSAH